MKHEEEQAQCRRRLKSSYSTNLPWSIACKYDKLYFFTETNSILEFIGTCLTSGSPPCHGQISLPPSGIRVSLCCLTAYSGLSVDDEWRHAALCKVIHRSEKTNRMSVYWYSGLTKTGPSKEMQGKIPWKWYSITNSMQKSHKGTRKNIYCIDWSGLDRTEQWQDYRRLLLKWEFNKYQTMLI
jgi:hypothetical protein